MPARGAGDLAAVIASQAVISGAFSMTRQAIQLGFLPRMQVVYTSAQRGRPDLPAARQLGAAGRRGRARRVGFGSSSALAGGLRHRGDGDDADHDRADLLRRAPRLGLPAAGRARRHRRSSSRSTRCWSPRARSSSSTAAGSRSCWARRSSSLMSTWKRGRELLLEHVHRDDPELLPFIDGARRATRCRAARAPPSSRSPTRAPCRRRCCTTSSTTRCCTSATSSSRCVPRGAVRSPSPSA